MILEFFATFPMINYALEVPRRTVKLVTKNYESLNRHHITQKKENEEE